MTAFVDDFDGPELDTDVWLPHYLPLPDDALAAFDGGVLAVWLREAARALR